MNTEGANPKQIAEFYLAFCREHGDYLTNLKLQKLVYYAQAWFLALHNKPLFKNRIEAWVHGPAIPSLYGEYKKHGWQPILCEAVKPKLLPAIEKHLIDVFSVYGKFTAWELEQMTHREEPWIKARRGAAMDEAGYNEISHSDMREFYRELAQRNGEKK